MITGVSCITRMPKEVLHIKGRLLDQAVILFNCIPFSKRELLLKERICSGSEIFPLREVTYGMENNMSLSLSHWYPGSRVVLDCIDS